MSLIDSFKQFAFQDYAQQKSLNSGIFSFFAPTAMPRMGEKEFSKAYRSWVYACTNAIAERVTDIDLKLQTRNKNKWEDFQGTNPALDLLHDVNNFMSFYDLILHYQSFQELNGNTFWYLPRNGKTNIAEIWPLDPTRVQVVKSKEHYIAGYVFISETGAKVPFESEEIIHFKRFNPTNQYRGMGTVEAAAIPIDIDTYASEYQRNFFGNSAMPSGILSTPGTLTQDQYDRIKTNWDAKYRGVQNAHKMALLEAGLTWTPLTPTAREMQFADSRKNIRDEVLAIFRVPKPILGILEDVNLASADAADLLFNKNVVKPKMKFFVTKLTEFYLPLFGLDQREWRFWFTDPIPENMEQKRADRESGLQFGYLTPNEARAEVGLKPLEGGDELFIPSTMQPILQSINPDDPGKADEIEQEEDNAQDAEKSVKKNAGLHKSKKLEKSEEATKREQAYKQEQIATLHTTYLELNTDLQKRLLKRVKQYKATKPEKRKEPSTLLTRLYDAFVKDNQDTKNDPFQNEMVRFIFSSYDDWIGLVYNATEEGLTRIFEQSGKDTFADLNLEGSFSLQNPRALDWLSQHALEDSTSYSDTMKEDIALKVQEGVELGASNETIADSIKQFFTDQSDYRSMRIARTEVINGYAQGNLEGYRQSGGVVTGKFWVPDSEACPICVDNAKAGVIPLDADFPSGDPAPTAHPNSYAKDTEVYTKDGWKLVKDVEVGEEMLSLNPESMEVAYVPVVKTYEHYEETLISFYGRMIDLQVTKDHNMFYSKDSQKFGLIEANTLSNTREGIFLTSDTQGEERMYLYLADMEITEQAYNDTVYCVQVEKYHTLLVRRNAKVVWSGNCECSLGGQTDNS